MSLTFEEIINRLNQNKETELYFDIHALTLEQIILLTKALAANTSLKKIIFGSHCNLRNIGAIKIADMLKVNQSLTEIDLGANNIGPIGVEAIADALRVNKTCRVLLLGSDSINPSMGKIAELLKDNNTMEGLSLDSCGIDDVGVEQIAEMLKSNNRLKLLSLGGNPISDLGAEKIADALKMNTTLTSLSLINCQLTTVGANKIMQALTANTSLTHLDLSLNHQINNEQIIDSLNQTALITLKLNGNITSDKCAKKIFTLLTTNTTLIDCDIGKVNVAAGEIEKIESQLRVNKEIQTLLNQNYFANKSLVNTVINLLHKKYEIFVNTLSPQFKEEQARILRLHRKNIRIATPSLYEIAANYVSTKLDDKSLPIESPATTLPKDLLEQLDKHHGKDKQENKGKYTTTLDFLRKGTEQPRLKLFNPHAKQKTDANVAKEDRLIWKLGSSGH